MAPICHRRYQGSDSLSTVMEKTQQIWDLRNTEGKNVFLQPQVHPYKYLQAFNYSSYSHFSVISVNWERLSEQWEISVSGQQTYHLIFILSYLFLFSPHYCLTELPLVCSCHICSPQIKTLQQRHIIFWHITTFCFKGFECEKELAEAMDKEKQAKGLLPTKVGSFTIGLGARGFCTVS